MFDVAAYAKEYIASDGSEIDPNDVEQLAIGFLELQQLLKTAIEIARDGRWPSRPPEYREVLLSRLKTIEHEGGL